MIQSIWDGKLSEVVIGTIPFHLIMFVVLGLVIFGRSWPCGCRPECRIEASAERIQRSCDATQLDRILTTHTGSLPRPAS